MLNRKDDEASLYGSLEKKIKAYSKNSTIKLLNPEEDPTDKVLQDLKDKERDRQSQEDDFLDELRIYDLSVIPDFWNKYTRKMLNLLIDNEESKDAKSTTENFDPTFINIKTLPCFHVNYIMGNSNTVR